MALIQKEYNIITCTQSYECNSLYPGQASSSIVSDIGNHLFYPFALRPMYYFRTIRYRPLATVHVLLLRSKGIGYYQKGDYENLERYKYSLAVPYLRSQP